MAAAQAGLFDAQQYPAEAEQAYRIACQICPTSPEVVYRLSELLARTGRVDEARTLIQSMKK